MHRPSNCNLAYKNKQEIQSSSTLQAQKFQSPQVIAATVASIVHDLKSR